MSLTKQQQRALPANRARIEVKAVDGSALASTTPQRARKLVKSHAARFHPAVNGCPAYLQMLQPCGSVVPQLIAPTGSQIAPG